MASESKPVYAVIGNDRFLRGEALGAILRGLEGAADDLGPSTFDGTRAELAEVLDEVRTMSLLGGRRIVIVDDADPFISRHRESLEGYCADPAPDGTLILSCSTMPKNTKLYKAIDRLSGIVFCEPLKGVQIGNWLVARAKAIHGKALEPPAAAALREHVGDVFGTLDAELSKLAAFVGPRSEITAADIDALVGQSREENVFNLVDAMASGDVAAAMKQWEQVLTTDRAAPGRAIAGLSYKLRKFVAFRQAVDRGASPYEAKGTAQLFNDAEVRSAMSLTTRAVEDQIKALCEADAAVKTGAATLERAIEQFIVTHTRR